VNAFKPVFPVSGVTYHN